MATKVKPNIGALLFGTNQTTNPSGDTYMPSVQGGLQGLGNMLSGFAAPFIQGGQENWLKQQALQQAQAEQDFNNWQKQKSIALDDAKLSQDKDKMILDLYSKSLGTTYTTTDPATGKAVTYSLSAGLPEEVNQYLQSEVNRIVGNKSTSVPSSNIIASVSGASIPPGVKGITRQGNKTSIIQDTGKTESNPQEQVKPFKRLVQFYNDSEKELGKKYGDKYQSSDVYGTAQRIGISVDTLLGQNPKTRTMLNLLESEAIKTARREQKGVITQRDADAFGKILVNTLKEPSETNVGLMSYNLLSMYDKGADLTEIFDLFQALNSPTTNRVMQELVSKDPDMVKYIKGAEVIE